MTPAEYGREIGYGQKTVRDNLRAMTDQADQPGSGGRWEIEIGSDFEIALRKRITDKNGNRKRVVRAAFRAE